MKGIELRIKAARANKAVLGATITYGTKLEVEAFAAPKTLGLWDDVRADLLDSKSDVAKEVPGVFGTEPFCRSRSGRQRWTKLARWTGPDDAAWHFLRQASRTDPDDEETVH